MNDDIDVDLSECEHGSVHGVAINHGACKSKFLGSTKIAPKDLRDAVDRWVRLIVEERLGQMDYERKIDDEIDRRIEIAVACAMSGVGKAAEVAVNKAIETKAREAVAAMPIQVSATVHVGEGVTA